MIQHMDNWISVKQRVPKGNKNVFVYVKKIGVTEDYYMRDEGLPGWAKNKQSDVTHWMPKGLMPKPPKSNM